MKNFIQNGDALDFVAGADLVSGQGLLIQDTFGFVAADTLTGEDGVLVVVGAFSYAKADVAITQFEAAYWDAAAKVLTNVATGNTLVGVFAADALIGDADGIVRLKG